MELYTYFLGDRRGLIFRRSEDGRKMRISSLHVVTRRGKRSEKAKKGELSELSESRHSMLLREATGGAMKPPITDKRSLSLSLRAPGTSDHRSLISDL